jgi:predicted PurR-regulated permease PerM
VRRSRRRFCRWPRRSTGAVSPSNYVVYPVVYRRAVELSAFTTIVAVLITGSLLGVVGAILAVPFAAVIKIVLGEAGAPRPHQAGGAARQLAEHGLSSPVRGPARR